MRESPICDKDIAQILSKPDRVQTHPTGVILALFRQELVDWINNFVKWCINSVKQRNNFVNPQLYSTL
jgi:hypothetical protein